jgi:hypothetical protein
VPRLDCDEAAEAAAKHECSPDAQQATGKAEEQAEPADGIAV